MGILLTFNGDTNLYPSTGDTDWGNQATQCMQRVVAGLLPKLGGTFLITGNIDFGSIAGLSATYFASNNNATVAGSGFLRLANADKLTWISTNAVDTYSLTVDSSNLLKFYVDSTPFRVAMTDLAQSFTKGQALTPVSVASSSGVLALDLSQTNNFVVTLTESISSITLNNALDGQGVTLVFKQGAGAFTVAWPAAFTFVGTANNNPAVTTVNTKISAITAVFYQSLGIWLCTLASQS